MSGYYKFLILKIMHYGSRCRIKDICGGSSGAKFQVSLSLLVGAMTNCADSTGSKNIYTSSVKGTKGRVNRLSAVGMDRMVMVTVKKDKPELRKKAQPAVVIQQQNSY